MSKPNLFRVYNSFSHLDFISGPQLKRIVVTSSCAAISNPEDTGILDESSWNESNIREIKEKGRNAGQPAKYRASKSLAEKGEVMSYA